MENKPIPHILRVTSLKSFFEEVSSSGEPNDTKPVLRLLNQQATGQHSAALMLSLQGLNAAGEVVWLCEVHTVSWLYGQPFGQAAESAYSGLRDLESIVCAHLEAHGFKVRSGDYGLPDSIKPLAASFECARWVRVDEYEWKVEAVSLIAAVSSP